MRLPVSQQQLIGSVRDALRKYDAQLKDINTKIWSNPELAYEEHKAHDHICALFDALGGYEVRRKAYGLNTALGIEYKHDSGGRVMVFNAEYDALPNIGHAYGHNLIAISSIAAFIATCEAIKIHGPEELGY